MRVKIRTYFRLGLGVGLRGGRGILWVGAGLALTGCMSGIAGVPERRSSSEPLLLSRLWVGKRHAQRDSAVSLWSKRTPGAISGLSASADGRAFLVATSPDLDIEGSSSDYLLSWYDRMGHLKWKKRMKTPVKDQDLADDGSFAVVSNYSDELMAWSAQGRLLWTATGDCRPKIVNRWKKVLCYHDDDAEPQIAFDLYDFKGRLLSSYSIVQSVQAGIATPLLGIAPDVLALKVNRDETSVVMGFTGGRVDWTRLSPSDERSGAPMRWSQSVDGEIVDVAVVEAGPSLRIAVLSDLHTQTQPPVKAQVISIFEEPKSARLQINPGISPGISPRMDSRPNSGMIVKKAILPFRANQIEFSLGGELVYFYGNQDSQLVWGAWSTDSMTEVWHINGGAPSEYLTPISVAGSRASSTSQFLWTGFEGGVGSESPGGTASDGVTRRSHLLAIDSSGGLAREIEIQSSLGSYIYAYQLLRDGTLAAVATDDGRLSVYRVKY